MKKKVSKDEEMVIYLRPKVAEHYANHLYTVPSFDEWVNDAYEKEFMGKKQLRSSYSCCRMCSLFLRNVY